jgi:selenide,water dikinase
VAPHTIWEPGLDETTRILLCDAQTSGGLLAFVPAHEAGELLAEWESAGYAASVIGQVGEESKPQLIVEA